MSFPALDTFASDIEMGFAAWKLYMWLQRNHLNHLTPKDTKISALCQTLSMGQHSVVDGLNRLVEKGYLDEHPAGFRGVRRFTLAWSVVKKEKDDHCSDSNAPAA
jgi:hypothetical protein